MFRRATAQNSPRGESRGSGEASASASSRVKPMRSDASSDGRFSGSAKRARMKLRALSTARAPLLFAERVVIEARQHMALLDRRSETLEEAMLRPVMHDEIRSGDQELRRDGDGAGVSHHAIRRLVERQQDVDGDRARDQRIGVEGLDALGIVGEEVSP